MRASPKRSPNSSKPLVGREHVGRVRIAAGHELKKHGAGLTDRDVAELVDHQECRMREHHQRLL
jgi:hypothetical protein